MLVREFLFPDMVNFLRSFQRFKEAALKVGLTVEREARAVSTLSLLLLLLQLLPLFVPFCFQLLNDQEDGRFDLPS